MINLVPFEKDAHSHLLYKWRQQPDIDQFMYSKKPGSLADHQKWVDSMIINPYHYQWVIEYNSQAVGAVSISNINHNNNRAELGLYIATHGARLMGVGAIAEFLALDEAFFNLKLHKLTSEVFSTNKAPIRMHERMGFKHEGILRQHARFDNEWINVHRLSILKEEWASERPKLKKLLSRFITSK